MFLVVRHRSELFAQESLNMDTLDSHGLDESVQWTLCAPSLDVDLGPDFLENNWSAKYTLGSQDIPPMSMKNLSPSLYYEHLCSARQCSNTSRANDTAAITNGYHTFKQNGTKTRISSRIPDISQLSTIPSFSSSVHLRPLNNTLFLDQDTSGIFNDSQEAETPIQASSTWISTPRRLKFFAGAPGSISQRMEALYVDRPPALLFAGDSRFPSALNATFVSQEASDSPYLYSNFPFDTSISSVTQPFPSTASMVRFFANDGIQHASPTSSTTYPEDTFNDSGLDLPFIMPASSWGVRGSDLLQKPSVLGLHLGTPVSDADSNAENRYQYRRRSLFHEHLHIEHSYSSLDMEVDDWTFDEYVVISLLEARQSRIQDELGATMKRSGMRTPLLAASDKIIKVAKRCVSMLVSTQCGR